MSDADTPAPSRLGEDLRRAVSRFVRAIRQESGTPRSAQSEALALLAGDNPAGDNLASADAAGNAPVDGRQLNIATLADLRGVKHQTMRLILAQLETAGLVRRTPDPVDRRSQLFAITPAGRAELDRERAARASRIEAALVTQLSAPERALLQQAIPLLERLAGPGA